MEPLVEMSIKIRYGSLIKTKACNLLFGVVESVFLGF
jgi:hypothetical protein